MPNDPRPTDMEWARFVRDAVSSLDDAARRALILVYAGGLTQARAAARLRMSENVLRHHIARGMRQLATIIVSERLE